MSPLRRPDGGQHVRDSRVSGDLIQVRGDYIARRRAGVFDYTGQVRLLAPAVLRDREDELAELARFCTAPDGPAYSWWRAGAWAGKSALLTSFVLDPPEGVRIVSFFITARYAAHNDRTAFLDIVLAQLSEQLGEDLPYLTTAMREAHLVTLYERAAAASREAGKRLVLVVDGLDEDRSRAGGGDRSIAGLLPEQPPHGMRVIVASRPHPPVPSDVRRRHPLRDPAIVRELSRSPYAEADRFVCQQDLTVLLGDRLHGAALLGLIAAAGGGLTAGDLAELAGVSPQSIAGHLRSIAGRTFRTQQARWDPAGEVLVLAHDDLRTEAIELLGPELESYRGLVHAWAGRHRAAGWPPGTPEYLLLGYFRMLVDHGDVERIAACATDSARHERIRERSGGDSAALSEIAEAQDVLLRRGPALLPMARLAMHRASLAERNACIPPELPAVWASIGDATRAIALAGALPPGNGRDQSLAEVSAALIAHGDLDGARSAARRLRDPSWRAASLAAVSRAQLAAGDPVGAKATALDVTPRGPAVLAVLAEIMPDQSVPLLTEAVRAIGGITSGPDRDRALAAVAAAAARIGDLTTLDTLIPLFPDTFAGTSRELLTALLDAGEADRAETIVSATRDPSIRADGRVILAHLLLDRAETGRANALIEAAAADATAYPSDELAESMKDWALAPSRVAEVAARARLDGLVGSLADHARRSSLGDVDAAIARGYAAAGALELAERVAQRARPFERVYALAPILRHTADPADRERIAVAAEEAAWQPKDARSRTRALTAVAAAAADSGDAGLAGELALDVEREARSIADPGLAARTAAAVGLALAPGDPLAGELARAAAALAAADGGRGQAAVAVAGLRLALGDPGPFDRLTAELSINPDRVQLAELAAAIGEQDRAEAATAAITDNWYRIVAVAAVAAQGDPARAEPLTRIAAAAAGTFSAWQLVPWLAPAHAAAGELDRAEELAAGQPVWIGAEVARIAATRGDIRRAHRLLAACADPVSAADEIALGLAWLAAGDPPAAPSGPGFRARRQSAAPPVPAREQAAGHAARALALGDVLGPWRLIAALDPEVPRAIAGDLIASLPGPETAGETGATGEAEAPSEAGAP